MRARKKCMVIFVMIFALLISLSITTTAVDVEPKIEGSSLIPLGLSFVEQNIDSLVKIDELTCIAQRRNKTFLPQHYSVKQLVDFNGYIYYVVEFDPVGYAIYDNQFANILEFNADAISPYYEYIDNIIYAGAGEYYVKSASVDSCDVYRHTVQNSEIHMDDATKAYYQKLSTSISSAVESDAIQKMNESSNLILDASSDNYASLRKYTSITDRDTTGFNTDGNCGYISGSLIVWYHYDVLGWTEFVPGGVYSEDLVTAIQGDHPNNTMGPGLQTALSDWSYNHGAVDGWQESLPALYDVLPSGSKIFKLIKENRPVALLGKVPSSTELDTYAVNGTTSHVITVTAVEKLSSSYAYFAHFGWEKKYNDVYITDSVITKGSIVYY